MSDKNSTKRSEIKASAGAKCSVEVQVPSERA